MTRQHSDEDVELGAEVRAERERPSGPVVAIRIPRDVLARLSQYASLRGTTVSDVVRQAAVRLVSETSPGGPYYVSGAELQGPSIARGPEPTLGGRVMTRDLEEVIRR